MLEATRPIVAEAFAPKAPTMAESIYCITMVVIWVRIAGRLKIQTSLISGFKRSQFCSEGTLEWVRKDEIHKLNLWEGDKIFFKLLNENYPVFSLKLVYENGNQLTEAVLDGRKLKIADYTK